MSVYIYEIRPVGTAYGIYLTHPEMNWWIQKDVFETLKEAKENLDKVKNGR